jgi:hypothetical protein
MTCEILAALNIDLAVPTADLPYLISLLRITSGWSESVDLANGVSSGAMPGLVNSPLSLWFSLDGK